MTSHQSAESDENEWLEPAADLGVHERFEWYAARHPEAIAVVHGDAQFTYGKINDQADLLAQHLHVQGLVMEEMVGICLERSDAFIIAVLGILKAGGAYVPLDPAHPVERTAAVIVAAGLRWVIGHASVDVPPGCQGIDLGKLEAAEERISIPVGLDQLLYVIHTSGSTGVPKGVLVTHRNVARLFDQLRADLGFHAGDRWSFCHSPAFGYSAWEIWGALSQGGTLVILPSAPRHSGPDFAALLKRCEVSVLSLTPSAFRHHLLEGAFDELGALSDLRMIALSGEAPVVADLQKWFALRPPGGPKLISTYAITETSGQVTWRMLEAEEMDQAWLGTVLSDTTVYLLDEDLRPVLPGMPGEICVAGPGLARGYLNEPELTTRKFVTDPFGDGREARIYRTGDRARLWPDGRLEMLGRMDDQIKLGGYRIELGEIESHIREHPAVAEAAVVMRQDRLIAYVVEQKTTPLLNTDELPEFWPSVGEYQVYDEVLYHFMTHEPVRTTAYRTALARHSKDQVVLDIGTGQDALLARYAAESGAKKVYAIELIPEAAARAQACIKSLGLSDTITVLRGDSTELTLPEQVDVWTQGIIGNIGSSDGIIPIANDARRWLKPDAIAIPSRCVTYFAAVELPKEMRSMPRFRPLARRYAEQVFDLAGGKFDIRLCVRNFPKEQLVSEAAVFEDLEFSDWIDPEMQGQHAFKLSRDACFDGFILWTQVTTTEGVSVDFLEHQQAWLPVYFPMSDLGLSLSAGTEIQVKWQRQTGSNGLNPDYAVEASIMDAHGRVHVLAYETRHHERAFCGNGLHQRLFAQWDESSGLPESSELRAYLAEKLPDHMVPAVFVKLDRLPRNANDKLDRAALPEPEARRLRETSEHCPPSDALECWLAGIWQEVLGIQGIGANDDYFALGGNSLQAISITSRMQDRLGEQVYVVAIFDAPTLGLLAVHLRKHYPAAIARVWPEIAVDSPSETPHRKLVPADVATMRSLLKPTPPTNLKARIPRAVFILSTHRSGSTLLRIMLAGHPGLLAPPELELLGFETLAERQQAFAGRDAHWLEGAIRLLMQLRGCSAREAQESMQELENHAITIPDFYELIQEEAGDKLLVDKSTHYTLSLETLRRAEAWFESPLYIHLLRHPCGSIQSYVDTRMEFFFRAEHPFTTPQLAELNWLISQQNTLEFLAEVPAQRQMQLRFEDLVQAPKSAMEEVCRFLGVAFDSAMLDPYGDQTVRMTDAIYPHSKMLGDVKFAGHRKINPEIAQRWRGLVEEDSLGDMTWELARCFGYEKTAVASLGVPSASADDTAPILSYAQDRFWFLHRMGESGHAQNVTGWIRLEGPLNVPALQASIGNVVARHQSLRTRVTERDGVAAPLIDAAPVYGWALQDLSALRPSAQEAAFAACLAIERNTAISLEQGPLVRFVLLQFAENDHRLIRVFHHITTDGWSTAVFNRELSAGYAAALDGHALDWPPLALQYSDFARWQKSALQAHEMQRQVEYWRTTLAEPTTLQLPCDHPHGGTQETAAGSYQFVLPAETVQLVEAFSHAERVTPFITILAVFQILLRRYANQDDVMLGAPTANRRHPAWEPLIGFFINTLVLRMKFRGDPSFTETVGAVREVVLAAFSHQDVPFDRLVEELNPSRNRSRHPFVQVLFQLRETPSEKINLPGITATAHSMEGAVTHFDLYLNVIRQPEHWLGTLTWKLELFDTSTIQRMARHFTQLLTALLTAPTCPISKASMLTAPERHRLLVEWNGTAKSYPLEQCVHQLIEAQTLRTPDHFAVKSGNQDWTYAEINAKANQLALLLRQMGVEKGHCVPVILGRSVELVIAELAVMKSGAAFVPMDPHWPSERIASILAQVHPKAVLVHAARQLAGQECIPVIAQELPGIEKNLCLAIASTDPIYVIFTSGSTGKPKGAINQHRGIVNRFFNMTDRFGCTPEDRILATTAPVFDSSVWQLFWPLANGATIVLPTPEADPEELFTLIEHQGITFTDFVPAVFELLVRRLLDSASSQRRMGSLRQIIIGGEEINAEWVWRCKGLYPQLGITNAYGPTETSIGVIFYDVPNEPSKLIPIGKPLHNVHAVILDQHLALVPIGVAGELCLGGACVGLGYLNDPGATNAVFVENPFPELQGAKLYRTGDRARLLPDGNIEYLGRRDHQVKIRGFRIELGEIDAQLRALPMVQAAITVIRSDEPSNPRLVAYLTMADEESKDPVRLKAMLGQHLPSYMVPQAWVFLESLPLTAGGKVDRTALAARPLAELSQMVEHIAPRNYLEGCCLEIWETLLPGRAISVHDDFFDLGGHSLLALQMFAKLKELIGSAVPMATLFEAPTIALLAERISQFRQQTRQGGTKLSRHLICMRQGDAKLPTVILIPGGWGGDDDLKFFAEHLLQAPGANPILGVNMRLFDPRYPFPEEISLRAKRLFKEVIEQTGVRPFHIIAEGNAGVIGIELARLAIKQSAALDRVVLMQSACPVRTLCQRQSIVGPQLGEPDPDRDLPAVIEHYYRQLQKHRLQPFSHPVDLVISQRVASESDPSLGWKKHLTSLRTHVADGPATTSAEPGKILKMSLSVISFESANSPEIRPSSISQPISRHLIYLQAGDSERAPLVILPGGAGGQNELLVFARLIRFLPVEQPVIGVDLGLFDTRVPFPASLEQCAARLCAELFEHTQAKPFHLLGECLAGATAYAIGQQAHIMGHAPLSLTLLDAACPGSPSAQIHYLRPEAPQTVLENPSTEGAHRGKFDAHQLERYLRMLKEYQPTLSAMPLQVVNAAETPVIHPQQGWDHFSPNVQVRSVPGSHHSYIRKHAASTARVIAEILESHRATGTDPTKIPVGNPSGRVDSFP